MPWLAVAAGIGAVGSLVQANQARQTAKGLAGEASRAAQVDIERLNNQISELSKQNAQASADLEKQLTPEVPALRTSANNAIAGGVNDQSLNLNQSYLMSLLGRNVAGTARSPLLQSAIDKAQADLGLGSSLSPEIQNLVARHGLATAGSVAPGTLGLGRDVVARDLGLTGLQVEQQRLQNATQLGSADAGMRQFDVGTQFNNNNANMGILQLLQAISGQRFGQNLAAGQYAQSIRQPVVGLDPSSAGNIAVGNQNAQSAAFTNQANMYGTQAQGMTNLAGQFVGLGGLAAYNQFLAGQKPNLQGSNPNGAANFNY